VARQWYPNPDIGLADSLKRHSTFFSSRRLSRRAAGLAIAAHYSTKEMPYGSKALFSWGKKLALVTVALSFVFDNYCLIID